MDKSKANGLMKLLAVTQALWFCLQCITRLSQELPIALLEIHVFGYAVCAFLIYVLWWDKPFDVEQSTLLKGDKIECIASLLRLYSPIERTEEAPLQDAQWRPSADESRIRTKRDQLDIPIELYDQVFDFTYVSGDAKTLRPAEIEQLQAASCALNIVDWRVLKRDTQYLRYRVEDLVSVDRFLETWANPESQEELATWASLTVGCVAFGTLHLISWFAPFHRPLEMQLWRISAIAITCTGPALFCSSFISLKLWSFLDDALAP